MASRLKPAAREPSKGNSVRLTLSRRRGHNSVSKKILEREGGTYMEEQPRDGSQDKEQTELKETGGAFFPDGRYIEVVIY
jgi:hypothetical protein